MSHSPHAPLHVSRRSSVSAVARLPAPVARAPVPIRLRDLRLVVPAALAGAGLVHGLEYHLGLGDTAGHMLATCPLRGGLLLIALFVVATILMVWREVRALVAEYRILARAAAEPHRALTGVRDLPRRPGRLVALLLAVFLAQVACYALAQHLWPMSTLMWMHGGVMRMPIDGALPLLPAQLTASALMALAIWRLERQVSVLCAGIARLRRALRMLDANKPSPAFVPPAFHPARLPAGLLGFSRPPPLVRG